MSLWIRGCGLAAALALIGTGVGCAQAAAPAGAPGITRLAGARDRPGLFTERLVLPAGFCGRLHTHDQDLHGLVLRGALRFGVTDSLGRLEVREYPAGSFVPIAAGRPHLEGSAEETEILLSGIGPLHTAVTDSAAGRCEPTGR